MCSLAPKKKKKFKKLLPNGHQKVESAKENSKIHTNDRITLNRLKNIRILKASPNGSKRSKACPSGLEIVKETPL